MKNFSFASFFLLMLMSIAVVVSSAQGACPALVREALEAVDSNCDDTGRNEACYGYNRVEAAFVQEIPEGFFSQPSDISDLRDLQTIRTAPLRLADGTWGVAVLNAQADIPNAIPGQNVTFILLGDAEMTNAVPEDQTLEPVDPVEVVTTPAAGANIRSGPGANFNVVGGAAAGTALLADGISTDGTWLRVVYNARPAWIARSVVESETDLSALPVLTENLRTPMQAFYLRTGIGQPECAEVVDDALIIQGPDDLEVSLTVNGAEVLLGSTGLVYLVEIDGQLYLEWIVVDGYFIVDGVRIETGQTTRQPVTLDENGNPIVTGPPTPPAIIDVCEGWESLEWIPGGLLNYAIDVTCADELISRPAPTNPGITDTAGVVDVCDRISINPDQIIATNFVLSWDAPSGYLYEVAALDSSGYQVTAIRTTETSIPLNGGAFPSQGQVHIRAYTLDGDYICFRGANYNRKPDPNEPPGGYPLPSSFTANIVECFLFMGEGWEVTFSWENADGDVNVSVGEFPPLYPYGSYSGDSGTETIFASSSGESTTIYLDVSSGGETISLSCSGGSPFAN